MKEGCECRVKYAVWRSIFLTPLESGATNHSIAANQPRVPSIDHGHGYYMTPLILIFYFVTVKFMTQP